MTLAERRYFSRFFPQQFGLFLGPTHHDASSFPTNQIFRKLKAWPVFASMSHCKKRMQLLVEMVINFAILDSF